MIQTVTPAFPVPLSVQPARITTRLRPLLKNHLLLGSRLLSSGPNATPSRSLAQSLSSTGIRRFSARSTSVRTAVPDRASASAMPQLLPTGLTRPPVSLQIPIQYPVGFIRLSSMNSIGCYCEISWRTSQTAPSDIPLDRPCTG